MNKGSQQASGAHCLYLNSGNYLIDEQMLAKVFKNPIPADVCYGNVDCIEKDKVIEHQTYPDKMNLTFLFRAPWGLYCNNYSFYHLPIPIVYFDTEGMSSNPKTMTEQKE